jgi:hypothetical protein
MNSETFEKCSFLFKFKEGENFNHPSTICQTYGAGRNTLSISRINPPKFGGGLKFEPDVEIGQKGVFCKGLIVMVDGYPTLAGLPCTPGKLDTCGI